MFLYVLKSDALTSSLTASENSFFFSFVLSIILLSISKTLSLFRASICLLWASRTRTAVKTICGTRLNCPDKAIPEPPHPHPQPITLKKITWASPKGLHAWWMTIAPRRAVMLYYCLMAFAVNIIHTGMLLTCNSSKRLTFLKACFTEILAPFTVTQTADDFVLSMNALTDRTLQYMTKFRKGRNRPIITVPAKKKKCRHCANSCINYLKSIEIFLPPQLIYMALLIMS